MKKNKIIHVITGENNGIISNEELPEGIVKWGEALGEGPLLDLELSEFWMDRAKYFEETSNVSEKSYYENIVMEFGKLRQQDDVMEIVLWHKDHLNSQFSLVFLLNWLADHNKENIPISLISLKSIEDNAGSKYIEKLDETQLGILYPNRNMVGELELSAAKKVWKALVSSDPLQVEKLIYKQYGVLKPIKNALLCHLRRFPSIFNGLGYFEQLMLELIEKQPISEEELISTLIANEQYGYNAQQIRNYIKRLKPLIIENDKKMRLNDLGRDIFNGKEDFTDVLETGYWLAGVYIAKEQYGFRWDEDIGKLT